MDLIVLGLVLDVAGFLLIFSFGGFNFGVRSLVTEGSKDYSFLKYLGAVLIVAGFLLQILGNTERQEAPATYEPYRATLSGEYLCVPRIDEAPQEECVPGMRTDAGEYYGVNQYVMSQEHKPLTVGDRISASGMVTPVERLSSSHWRAFPIKGIFSITDSLEVTSN